MTNRIFALLLTLSTAICLIGCEPTTDKSETDAETTENTVATVPSTNEPTEAPTEAPTETCTDGEIHYPWDDYGDNMIVPEKPVIYLYPRVETDVEVKLDFEGTLTCTYPEYNNGWRVTARPDGTLIDKATGKEYSYLFWEGVADTEYDMSRGYVVKGEETADFLEDILAEMGLTPKEYNDFIVYWLPRMQNNRYNLITFQGSAYTDSAPLTVTPTPDSILRVFMAFKALDEPIEIEEPTLTRFKREGFTLVEWGGAEVR